MKTLVSNLRKTAAKLKTDKMKTAKEVVTFITSLRKGIVAHSVMMRGVSDMGVAFSKGVDVIAANEEMTAAASTLVANVINDAGARVNEFANLIETISKDPGVRDAIDSAKKSMANMANLANMDAETDKDDVDAETDKDDVDAETDKDDVDAETPPTSRAKEQALAGKIRLIWANKKS